jgi:predicted Rossmann fold nucleotide-binding protein DprA/Smf involved in DNA uptake
VSHTAISPSATHLLEWLAISLTPGLGPTKSRKLVERFGSPEGVLRASLTELEGAGIQAVSAQSLATGKSAELAREEIARAAAAAGTWLPWTTRRILRALKKSMTRLSFFMSGVVSTS